MMSTDASPHPLVVVGAGAAGLYLMRCLGTTRNLLLLESGPQSRFDGCDPRNAVHTSGPYLNGQTGRARGLGGTTNLWGGQLLPFSVHDLSPENGWPLSLGDLRPHYEAVSHRLLAEPSDYGEEAASRSGWPLPNLNDDGFESHVSKWLAKPRFRHTLARTWPDRVVLCCNISINAIEPLPKRGYKLHGLDASGNPVLLEASQVVIATGTLESVRLLFASRALYGLPVANAVGQGFMDHVSVDLCVLRPTNRWCLQRWFNTRRFSDGKRYSVRLSASAGWLKSKQLLNASAMVMVRPPRQRWKQLINAMAAFCSCAVKGFVFKPYGDQVLNLMVEQSADQADRFLANSPDGLPLIQWEPNQGEAESALALGSRVVDALWRSGWLNTYPLLPSVESVQASFTDVCHPMGGAAMHLDPSKRVVTRDLEVINCPGLWLASAAVFPSGSHSNPTMTLLALVERLARALPH